MRYLPIHLDTQDQIILIVGGGAPAEAKLRTLVKTNAELIVMAPFISPEISRLVETGRVIWKKQDVTAEDIQKSQLVYAATDDAAENSRVAQAARALGVFVNAADQKEDCDFFTPALVDRSPVIVSIGTEGTSPGLARAIKADMETRLPSKTGELAKTIERLRAEIAGMNLKLAERQRIWANILSGPDLGAKLRVSTADLERRVADEIRGVNSAERAGHVALVGAGPGNAELLTLGARQKLHSADVIVYDRLVSQDVLDFGRREAEYIYVGKEPGGVSTSQDEINGCLVEKAKQGLFVVRLKSGDPLIFGRADEEIDALDAAGISFEIVPGITAAAAAAAEIGASLTTRGHNKAVALLTGHDAKGFAEHDWKGLASPDARAVVYMGVGAARFIQGRLLLHGALKNLPVTVVENASRPEQVIVSTTLENLPQDIEKYRIKGPAVLLLGYESKGGFKASEVKVGAAI